MPRTSNELRRQYSVMLEPSVADRLRQMADRKGTTPSGYGRMAIISRLEQDEAKNDITLHISLCRSDMLNAMIAAGPQPLVDWATQVILLEALKYEL